jgi:CRISPR-associated protein Cmr4
LEERQFEITGSLPEGLSGFLEPLLAHDSTRRRVEEQTAVLHNDDFHWFATYGLAVTARNDLDEKTKESNNLWYEESLPPDSLFYALLADRRSDGGQALTGARKLLSGDAAYLQVGGNETVGQGWFAIQWLDGEEAQ